MTGAPVITPDRRRDASMALLADLVSDARDPAYGAAARRRGGERPAVARPATDGSATGPRPAAAGPTGRRAGARRAVILAVLTALGVATGAAVAQVRDRADDAGRGRLVEQVRARTAGSDALQAQVTRQRAEVRALHDLAPARDEQGRAQAERLQTLELGAAALPVSGPGLVVTLDDRPAGADPAEVSAGAGPDDGRVLDRDLQDVVNGLWAAGAEAISIADLRLTSRTSIRSAGEAVLVDFRPVSAPYVVRAVGEPGRLEPAFVSGPTGRRWATYPSRYGLGFSVAPADDLALPAGGTPELRSARAAAGL